MGFLHSQWFVTPKYPTKSFSGQTVIVTGSNVGLGLEAARHFARLGAGKVILAVRNLAAGEEAKQSIEASTGRTSVCEVWALDLASYASVQAFAQRASSNLSRIDVLLENAGIATRDFRLVEGHERTITVNVISTFLLALLLLPKLEETAKTFRESKPRLSIVTSGNHASAQFPERKTPNIFETLRDEKSANMVERYPLSKLLEILVIRELAPKLSNLGVILDMTSPGLCHSQLAREAGWRLSVLKLFLARSTEVGSRTLLAAASVGEDGHGAYLSDGNIDNSALSPLVLSEDGVTAQKKVWAELKAILEKIAPGVTGSL